MKRKITNNEMAANDFSRTAEGILSDIMALRDIRKQCKIDSEGKRTHEIEALLYDCIDTGTLATCTIKTLGNRPILSAEELEKAEGVVYIEIPVEQTIIKPYRLEYGKVKVSIIAPYVKLHEE